MKKLFTTKRTFYVYDGMAVPQYSEIEVTITNDSSTILDGEFVETRWFSDYKCKILTKTTDEIPTDKEIETWIRESERADEVSATPFEDGDEQTLTVENYYGEKIDFEQAMNIADRELCEELHFKLAPCTDQEFFDAYCEAHEVKYGEDFAPYVKEAW